MKIHTVELWPGAPELHEVVLHSEHTQALARAEAERDAERARGDAAVGDANEAEAKLASAEEERREAHWMRRIELSKRLAEEMDHGVTGAHLDDAIGLLQFAYDHAEQHRPGSMPNEQEVRAFLARHAQAEQQEAQPARVVFDEWRAKQEAQGAQGGDFQREERYIVIKRKDLDAAPMKYREWFKDMLSQLEPHLPKRECLVIESDWPEYEPTWEAIQARVEGRAALATQPADWVEPVAWARQCDLNESYPAIFVAREQVQESGYIIPLFIAAPPAAAHGDDAVLKDAERYRWLRRKVAIVGAERKSVFHILNLEPRYIAPNPSIEFDAAIDAATHAQAGNKEVL